MRWIVFALLAIGAFVVIVTKIRQWRDPFSLSREIQLEEATVEAARSGHHGEVVLGEPQKLTAQEFMKEIESAPLPVGTSVSILIPGAFRPLERGKRFEEPLQRALGDLGSVEGGGSFLEEVGGEEKIVRVDILLRVRDPERALPVIRKTLKTKGAPKGTKITIHSEPEQVFTLD